jgi:CheY-like chemotaxis protein
MLPEYRAVLHVDDSPDDRFLFEQAWKKAGIRNPLRILSGGRSALEYLSGAGPFADRTAHPLPAMALLDIKMPDVTGLDLLARIRESEHLRRLPVFMLTASTLPRDVSDAYRLGATGFLIKPSSIQDLVEMLEGLKGFFLRFIEFPEL